MKYLIAFLLVSLLVACGDDKAPTPSTNEPSKAIQSPDQKADLVNEGPATDKTANDESNITKTAAVSLSLVKQCADSSCEGYHLMIDNKQVLSVDYVNKKKQPTRFVLTENNQQVLANLLTELSQLQTSQLIQCLNDGRPKASYSLTVGDVPNSTSYLFAVGCQSEPAKLPELAQWFDNKAYAAVEN